MFSGEPKNLVEALAFCRSARLRRILTTARFGLTPLFGAGSGTSGAILLGDARALGFAGAMVAGM